MNCGCAIVASDAAGASKSLISNSHNGFLYKWNNYKSFCRKVQSLLLNDKLRKKLAIGAYITLLTEWSPVVASNRLLDFYNSLKDGHAINYGCGPPFFSKKNIKCFFFSPDK